MRIAGTLLVTLALLGLFSCGGGGGPQRTAVKATIHWGARSRIVSAPSSALSAAVTLQGANPAGGDFSFTVNRQAAPDAYSQTYSSPTEALTGTWPVTVRFFAQADGQGSVVGVASATARIDSADGSIGDLTTVGTVASVEVAGGQFVKVGERKDMAFTAKDASGKILALTPGSAFFSVVIGQENLRIANGQAEGLAPGAAQVMATVDSKTSLAAGVNVLAGGSRMYSIIDLGTLGGEHSQAIAINNLGHVIGLAERADLTSSGVLWKNGQVVLLPLSPQDINDIDHVVGEGANGKPVLWQNGVVTILKVLSGGLGGNAQGINNDGLAVGWSDTADRHERAVLWENSAITDLAGLPGSLNSFASDINTNRQIVGGSQLTPDIFKGFLRANSQTTDLGPIPSVRDRRPRINAAGQVAGTFVDGVGAGHAFLWSNGKFTPLPETSGVSGSRAMGINSTGDVVGVASFGAVIWRSGKVAALHTLIPADSGWSALTQAEDINDAGQIAGSGFINGHSHAFLMTPRP